MNSTTDNTPAIDPAKVDALLEELARIALDLDRLNRSPTFIKQAQADAVQRWAQAEMRQYAQRWRNDAFENTAKIAERYNATYAAGDIRALISAAQPPEPKSALTPEQAAVMQGVSDDPHEEYGICGYCRARGIKRGFQRTCCVAGANCDEKLGLPKPQQTGDYVPGPGPAQVSNPYAALIAAAQNCYDKWARMPDEVPMGGEFVNGDFMALQRAIDVLNVARVTVLEDGK